MNDMEVTAADVHAFVPCTLRRTGRPGGPLGGLTFVAKDMFAIDGHISSFGHPTWRSTHEPSSTTAPSVELLLEAGASLVGLTKMDQLAYSLIGDAGEGLAPINTTAPELFCGGSSSGSASAVTAGLADVGLGTDTAGSIRVPAAVCGVHSIRPSHGAIDASGALPLAPSLDAVGLLSRSASLLTRAFEVLAPSSTTQTTMTSVIFARDVFDGVDDETSAVGSIVADRLAAICGAEVREGSFSSYTSATVGDLFARIQSREIWRIHGPWVTEHGHHLSEDVQQRLRRCADLSNDDEAEKQADLDERASYSSELHDVLSPGTLLVLPVLPSHGPLITWEYEQLIDFRRGCFRLSAPSSLAGAPQAVYSLRSLQGERSIGIGLLAAPGCERVLLDAMSRLEAGGS